MIVLRNDKIIAIEKKFLEKINITLEEISNLVTSLQLKISALTNEPLSIKNLKFSVHEKEVLSIENIKIFELKEITTEISEEYTKPAIDIFEQKSIEIKPLEIETFPASEEKKIELQIPSIEIEPKLETEETNDFKFDIQKENINIEQIEKENHEIKKEIKPIEKEEEISIDFEDEFDEIEQFLNLPKEEATEQIKKELEKAAEDLSIDYDTIYDLKEELFEMFKTEKEKFLNAVTNENYEEIHKIAHKLKGAALNLRLSNIALILKKIDELSKNKSDIHKIKYLTDKFYSYLEKIEEKQLKIPKEIKNLILTTIQDYLETQNEKRFKKDKKYIEKLLNVKIDTIEDLQKILKES
ncbi:hypothetical protein [Caminibacter sp.]